MEQLTFSTYELRQCRIKYRWVVEQLWHRTPELEQQLCAKSGSSFACLIAKISINVSHTGNQVPKYAELTS